MLRILAAFSLISCLSSILPTNTAFYCHPDGRLERIPKEDPAEVEDRFPQTVPGVTNPAWSRTRARFDEFGLAPNSRRRYYS